MFIKLIRPISLAGAAFGIIIIIKRTRRERSDRYWRAHTQVDEAVADEKCWHIGAVA